MQSYQNEKMTFSEHFSELFSIIRFSALGVVITSIFLSFYIDDILSNWLNSLSLDSDNFVFSVYSPYDWIDTKWALLLIFSIAMILPYTPHIKLEISHYQDYMTEKKNGLHFLYSSVELLYPFYCM